MIVAFKKKEKFETQMFDLIRSNIRVVNLII
jgi:hypothetical protein